MAEIQAQSLEELLKEYTWQNRVVLIIAPAENNEQYIRQKEQLAAVPAEVSERDIVVLERVADQLSTQDWEYVRNRFKADRETFRAILIGKDGGVKANSREAFTREYLFGTIDAMPMRRQEMRSKRNE